MLLTVSVPVRACDLGGWTDTWFGGPGRVCNVAVAPGITIAIEECSGPLGEVAMTGSGLPGGYKVTPGEKRSPVHPLIEAVVDTVLPHPSRGGSAPSALRVHIEAGVPQGCGLGTSAAVTVALSAGLLAARGSSPQALPVAALAHRIEVEVLGTESGVQDQLCAAVGGFCFIKVGHYPDASAEQLPFWAEIVPLVSVVYLGQAHHSSDVHATVIAERDGTGAAVFDRLRSAAVAGREAVISRDVEAFAAAIRTNAAAQSDLHPALVSRTATEIMGLASQAGCLAWKVNGAGGEGGSLTLLSPSVDVRAKVEESVRRSSSSCRILDVRPCPTGLTVDGADLD